MKETYDPSSVLRFPTNLTIVGVGGCGKKLAREVCSYDWLLDYCSENGNRLNIYTMDTDIAESKDDQKLAEKIMRKVNASKNPVVSEFISCHLPQLANVSSACDLTSSKVSASIKRTRSINTWWLHDPENNGITFQDLKDIDHKVTDDFTGGVHRRRAISKAVLYKVLSQGQTKGWPDFSVPGDTAIIVGIGGGTGSGMFIDLARAIREKRKENNIYLFAVLPTTSEGEKEKLNAAIALTEIEFLNVSHEERLFDHVIFVSLGPTGYKNGDNESEVLHDFDSVFPQILVNYFHVQNSDLHLDDTEKSYSSFVFADSHIIEYPVEELRNLKKQYNDIVDELGKIVDEKNKLNENIEELLTDKKVIELLDKSMIKEQSTPTVDVFEFLKTEYRNIEKVWKNNIAKLLKYHSVEKIEEYIKYNIPDTQFEKIGKYDDFTSYISQVKYCTQNVEPHELKDETDKKLSILIPKTLETLEKTSNLFKRVAVVENEECRSVLINILKGKKEISPLVGTLKIKRQEKEALDIKLKETEQKINELNSLSTKVDEKIEIILNDIDSDLASYAENIEILKNLPDNEKELKNKLDEYISKLKSGKVKEKKKDNWYSSTGRNQLREDIGSVSSDVGLNLESLNKFMDSVTDYYYYKYMLEEIEKFSMKRFLVGNKQALKSKYTQEKGKAEEYINSNKKDWGIVIAPPFEIIIPEDFLTLGLIKKSEELIKKIFNSIYNDLNKNSISGDLNKDSISIEKMKVIFEFGDRIKIRQNLREYLRGLYLNVAGYFKKEQELSKYKRDLEEEIKEKSIQLNMLEKVEDSRNKTFTTRDAFEKEYTKFNNYYVNINKEIKVETTRGVYKTKFGDVNPQILSLVGDESNLSNLDADANGESELDKLINLAKSRYQNLFESRKLGVNSLRISLSDTEKWNFDKAALVVSSTSGYVRSELMRSNMRREINSSLSLRDPDDALFTTHGHTKPWEIALTFFAASSFFDNIYPLVAGGGYWENYAKNKENILHHVLKLQDGKYITREAILSSEAAGKIANNDNIREISRQIMGLYKTKSLKEALKLENQ